MIPQTEVPNEETPMAQTPAATQAPAAAPTTGYKSSEFAVTVASAVALGSGLVPAHYQPLVVALAGVYTSARTLLKVVHALGYAKQVPDLPALPANEVTK